MEQISRKETILQMYGTNIEKKKISVNNNTSGALQGAHTFFQKLKLLQSQFNLSRVSYNCTSIISK